MPVPFLSPHDCSVGASGQGDEDGGLVVVIGRDTGALNLISLGFLPVIVAGDERESRSSVHPARPASVTAERSVYAFKLALGVAGGRQASLRE